MDERTLADEWREVRLRSRRILPVAIVLFVAVASVVSWGELHSSEFGFLSGVLVGTFGYWVTLEAMTVVRMGRLLQRVTKEDSRAVGSCPCADG
mgnify:CR=1 FL=1